MRALLFVFVMLLLFGGCARDELRGSFGCPQYQLVCDGVCTDVSTDPAHCGACDAACSEAEECLASRCRPGCEEPQTLCADGCVNTESDPDNCGACGNDCAPGAGCVRGECSATDCPRGQQLCGDECIDTSSDVGHCGECFAACPEGARCEDNTCVDGCGEWTNCDGTCVDLMVDAQHCGDCDTNCGRRQLCFDGSCTRTCPDDLVRCDDRCADLQTDRYHCGSCNVNCGLGRECDAGECRCSDPNATECEDGCVDLGSDPANCGGCGTACNGGTCAGGFCCEGSLVACGSECADLLNSAAHCGACFSACPDGRACMNGTCSMGCVDGFALCGQDCVNIDADPNNCGGCGVVCGAGQLCSVGACIAECEAPAIDCGNACVDPRTDPYNCGSCGLVCAEGLVCRGSECTDPALGCNFDNLMFPLGLNGGNPVGDVTIDSACNLYVGMQTTSTSGGIVYSISAETGTATPIAELSNVVRGLVYRPEDGLLYGTNRDRLISLQPDGLGLQVLDQSVTGEYLNGMALAPANWGDRAGYLVVAKNTGELVAYDPDNPVPEVFATAYAYISDVEFDGPQLYVAAHTGKQILRVTPGGVLSDFVLLPCSPDGLTVEPGVRLFAACGDSGEVYAIDLETRDFERVAVLSLNEGWAPSGLLWDNGALFVIEETTGLNVLVP